MADLIPHARIDPSFLESNAQAHHDILYAVADLLDNTREAGARRCEINVRRGGPRLEHTMVEMIDDGSGMTEATMRAMLSIAYTQKDRTTGKHYGMGSTTSIPRLCKSALCFSVHSSGHCTAGLLSTTLSKRIGANELKVPQCSWNISTTGTAVFDAGPHHDVFPPEAFSVRDTAPNPQVNSVLTEAARRESLGLMLAHTPFRTEAELIEEFRSIQRFGVAAARAGAKKATGTRWLLWGVNEELLLSSEEGDILVRGRNDMWPFERSLRGFCEILYYHDDEEERRGTAMVISIQGQDVAPRNWSQFLKQGFSAPAIKPPNALAATQKAALQLGYSRPLKEVVALCEERAPGKNDVGSAYYNVINYNGIFYYHKGTPTPGGLNLSARMTRALVPTKMQAMPARATQLATTYHRISALAKGVTGCCVENFLTQAHNKSEYTLDPDNPSGPSFEYLEQRVNAAMKIYVEKEVRPHLNLIMNRTDDGGKKSKKRKGEDDADAVVVACFEDSDEEGEGGGSSRVAVSGMTVEARLAADMEEGDRMESLTDGVVGRVKFVGKGKGEAVRSLIKLELPDGRLSKTSYRASELRKPKFNPAQLIVYPAPALALEGTKAHVWWNLPDEDAKSAGMERKGEWYTATLRQKPDADAEGWFTLQYDGEDEEEEDVFIGMRLDASWLACRDDGEQLTPHARLAELEARERQRAESMAAKERAYEAERTMWDQQLTGLSRELDATKEHKAKEVKDKKKEDDKFKQIRAMHKAAVDANAKLQEQLAAASKRCQAMERELRRMGSTGEDWPEELPASGRKKQKSCE